MPESCTELSTSFALASKGSCTWLSSLVSLACPSGPVVIHDAIPTLRLMRRSSYLIVNQEIRDRPSQKTSRYPVHPAASKESNQADKLFPHRTPRSPRANRGFWGWLVPHGDRHRRRKRKPSKLRVIDTAQEHSQPSCGLPRWGPQRLTRARPRARRGCGREGWEEGRISRPLIVCSARVLAIRARPDEISAES